jgi:short-subunit dehydrogenase
MSLKSYIDILNTVQYYRAHEDFHDWDRRVSRPVALVTGASAGIGVAFARRLAALGYDLVLVARRRDRLDALAAELLAAHAGLGVRVIARDLAASDAPAAISTELAQAGVAVDLLVNNAGHGLIGTFVQQPAENAASQIAVNVAALVALTHAFVPGMVARGRGGVINVASTASFQAVPNMAVYGATKAFVLSFSEALHEEVRHTGVKIIALCPGATATEFFTVAGDGATLGPQRTSEDVVATALRALDKNEAIAVDGPLNRIMATSASLTPRRFSRRIAARLMGLKRD